ncbi:MAG: hypothetical protein AAF710_07570 [Planctomycetota bacterium]
MKKKTADSKRIKRPGKNRGKVKPTEDTSPSPSAEYPSVSLRYLNSSHCISKCSKEDQVLFANRVRLLTQMTWAQINVSHRHGLGYEKINQLKDGLPADAGDQPALAFRFAGKKPMVGFRYGAVFYVVWFDYDFNLYDHG